MTENVQRVIITAEDRTGGAFRSFRRNIRGATESTNILTAASSVLTRGLGEIGVGFSLEATIGGAKDLETALVGVSKTTGLVGLELEDFYTKISQVSTRIPVTTGELLELTQEAGQLGVTGVDNLEKFAITLAKLGRASDLSGEQAAKGLARILNVTGESVDSIDTLASVIVSLGNSVAASESEIARMTTEVTRATSQFGVSSAEAAAMSAAMSSIGIQAELGGSAVGRAMQVITSKVREGGQGLEKFAEILDLNSETLVSLFENNKTEAFEFFLQKVSDLGLDAGNALTAVGLGGQEIAKTIIPLANNVETLTETLALANDEVINATALDVEFNAGLKTLDSQFLISKNIVEGFAASIGGVLVPALKTGLQAFNDFFQTPDTSPIVLQIQLVENLESKLASLRKRNTGYDGVFPGASTIFGTNKRDLDALEFQLSAAKEDLEKFRHAAKKAEDQIPKTAKEINKLPVLLKKAGVETGKAADKASQFVQGLKKEYKQAGLTAVEIKKLEAATLGVSKVADPLIDKIEQTNKQMVEESKVAQKLQSDLQKIEQITQSVRTEQEKFLDQEQELNRLLEQGLGVQTYSRALKKAEAELSGVAETTETVGDELNELWIQAGRNIQSIFAENIFSGFNDGLKGMVKNVISTVGRIVSEFAVLKVSKSIGLSGLFPSGSEAAGTGVGSASISEFNIVDAAKGAANLFSTGVSSGFGLNAPIGRSISTLGEYFGSSSLSSFGSGLSGSSSAGVFGPGGVGYLSGGGVGAGAGTGAEAAIAVGTEFGAAAGIGSSLAAATGPLALAYAATQLFKSFAGDKRLGGGVGNALNFVGDIPVLGEFIPVVPLINSIFGRGPLKQKETNLIGDFTDEGFSGATSIKFKSKGGLLRGNKVDRVINDTDTGQLLNQFKGIKESGISSVLSEIAEEASKASLELGLFLDDSVKGFSSSLLDAADVLGLGTSSIDNFSSSINIASKKGESLSEEQITDALNDVSESMATKLIPAISQLSERGETAFNTVVRLAAETGGLTNALLVFGSSAEAAKDKVLGIDFSQRSDIVKQFGGIDELNSHVDFFFNNALTAGERLQISSDALNKSLVEAGFSADLTTQQYKTMAESIGQVGGISIETAANLLPLAPQLHEVRNAAKDFEKTTTALTNALVVLGHSANDAESKVSNLGFGDKSRIVDLFGTQDALNSHVDFFFNNALTAGERLQISSDALKQSLVEAGLSADLTTEQYKTMGQSIGQVGGITDEAGANLLLLGPKLHEVTNAVQQFENTTKALTNALVVLGHSANEAESKVSTLSFADKSRIVDLFGTQDALTRHVTYFFDHALNGGERLQISIDALEKSLVEAGLSADLTTEQYKTMGQSIGQVGGITDEAGANLLLLGPQFDQVRNAAKDFENTTTALTNALVVLGHSANEAESKVSTLSFPDQSGIVKQFGGISELNSHVTYFFEHILNAGERFEISIAALEKSLVEAGFSADLTTQQYKTMVQSIGQVGGISIEAGAKLLLLGPQLHEVRNQTDEFSKSLAALALEASGRSSQISEQIKSERQSFEKQAKSERQSSQKQALDDLSRAVAAEQRIIGNQIDLIKKHLSELSGVLRSTGAAISDINPIHKTAARNLIQQAVNDSDFNNPRLSEAVSALTKSSAAGFSNRIDFLRDKASSVNSLRNLEEAASSQSVFEEQALSSLNLESQHLSNILLNAQDQLDALNGIKTLLSATKALDNFNQVLAGGVLNGSGVSADSKTRGVAPFVAPSKFNSQTVSQISDQQIIDFAKGPNVTEFDIYNAAFENGLSIARVSQVLGLDPKNVTAFLNENNLERFASGGITPGGPVIVGERGQEIVDLPRGSRVHSNNDSRKLLDNSNLEGLLKQILESVEKGNDALADLVARFKLVTPDVDCVATREAA